jgi:hypothetical protein
LKALHYIRGYSDKTRPGEWHGGRKQFRVADAVSGIPLKYARLVIESIFLKTDGF